ncbi:MAG: GGDEF domain-containing protein [Desulfobacula sp.]|nr:GGDEF domain-containing protein [Desulfobacula sp.]
MTLKYIAKYNLATNGMNLIIFYEYVEGKNSDLSKAIDKIVDKYGKIKPEQIKQIYGKYFNKDEQIIADKLLNRLNEIIKGLSIFFADSMDGMADQGRKVEDLAAQISQVKDYNDIDKIIDKMLAETKTLVLSNQKAYSIIKSSSENINILKSKLKKVKHEAQTDPLTNLANRRSFEQKMQYERIHAIENADTFCIMMVDIDCFKKINDSHGHLAGDSVLKNLADIFLHSLRQGDFSARLGGDEFCIILPGTKLSGASLTAVKIKDKINGRTWRLKGTGQYIENVTLSIGIAQCRFSDSNEELIKRADAALYLAKKNGKNCIKTEKEL